MPSYYNLPKFAHIPLACINPSPTKPHPASSSVKPQNNLDVDFASSVTLKPQNREKKELEPHLMRVPFDPNAAPKTVKKFVNLEGLNAAQKKAALAQAEKEKAEAKKAMEVKRSVQIIF